MLGETNLLNTFASFLILIAVAQSVLTVIALVGWWRGADNVLFPGLGLVVAMPGIIVLLLVLNIAFVIAASVVKPKKEHPNKSRVEQNFNCSNDIFIGCGNGVLDLSLAKDPNKYNENTDRRLKVCINDDDLEAVSLAVFSAESGKPYDDAEHILKKRNDNRNLFQKLFPAYPMLGRINYIYEDVIFNPEEVKKLREECLKLQTSKSDSAAGLGLRKLIYACDEALKENFYLIFSAD